MKTSPRFPLVWLPFAFLVPACWLLLRIAEAQVTAPPEAASEDYGAALEAAQEPGARAGIWDAMGDLHYRQSRFKEAESAYRSALAIRETIQPESLGVAASQHRLGMVMWYQGRLDLAARHHERALEIRQRLAPESLIAADSMRNLGNAIGRRGDLPRAKSFFNNALEIQRRLAPNSLAHGRTMNSLAVVALRRGELDEAATLFEHALVIQRRLDPESVVLAGLLNNLGLVAQLRGELALAVELQIQALEIQQRLQPGSLHVALSLTHLADLAAEQSDLEQAAGYHRRALEIRQHLAPASLAVADSRQRLAKLAADRGQLEAAERELGAALEIQQAKAPNSIHVATSLARLGQVAQRQRRLSLATDHYRRALEIWQTLAPRSAHEAETLHALGTAFRDAGQTELAARHLVRAIDSLEGQILHLGDSHDVRGSFRARQSKLYRDAISIHLDLGQPRRAFEIMERSRGQSFLALLAERDLTFSTDLPEDLEGRRRTLARRYNRIQSQLEGLSASADHEKVNAILAEQHKLFRERDEIASEIRGASPKLGAIHDPRPLDLDGVREALDPGTVLLAYSVGEARTELFVVTPEEGLADVRTLEIGAEELSAEVQELRRLVLEAIPGTDLGEGRLALFEELADRLYQRLIGPVAATVRGSERLLILPDGPLHLLPFACLVVDSERPGSARGKRYLAEWKPLHFALSATVYAELGKKNAPTGETTRAVAFGDPLYPGSAGRSTGPTAKARGRSAIRRGGPIWEPLPHTRQEVLRIAELFTEADTYLGAEASEENAKAIDREARVVHFATHGYLDDRFPLSSALVLSPPKGAADGRDNGLLYAWEIVEGLRLDADLVVLSACRSALGEERAGEGLLGLSRAFQFAGARSVAATLWSVADETTSELMVRFHRHLRSGKPTDQALQAAQVELIRAPLTITHANGDTAEVDASAPFYWAAFQLFGRWR